MKTNNSAQYNSIRGALYGVAVGDALGGPVEFVSRDEIRENFGFLSSMVGGGWLDLQPGEVTDDTQMTLCVAEGIAETSQYIDAMEAVGKHFLAWLRGRPKDIGTTCAASICTAERLAMEADRDTPTAAEWLEAAEQTQHANGYPSEGNGALMRTVYPGLYYQDAVEAILAAVWIGRMTHAGPESSQACKIYTGMIHLLTASENRPQDSQQPNEFLDQHCLGVWQYHHAATTGVVKPATGGYVVDSMRIAVGCLANSHNFTEAVAGAVNLGGDADTNGAITGGLAGAWYGYDAIPKEWVAALAPEVRQTLDRLADAAAKHREG